MFEICALLAPKKTAKARKHSTPSIKVGASVMVYGRPGVVVSKHDTHNGWWNVDVAGRIVGFDRCAIDVKA